MRKVAPGLLLLCSAFGTLYAGPDSSPVTETNPYQLRRHVVGIQASSIAGMGLSYKFALHDFLHWRATGMVFPAKSGSLSYTYSNIGTDLQFNLLQSGISQNLFFRAYVAAAISYWQTVYDNGTTYPELHTGATLGLEIIFASRLVVHGDLGLGYYRYGSGQNYYTTLAGGVGIGFLF